ncbi:MAG: hypothetical protein JEY97_00850 [Bacteroidales bacterium]|nr:hypothetical protein [Bacteroidales bacterium]
MKTLLILLTATLIMTFNSPETSGDFNIQIEDETYIDDIPFNTENVLYDFGININPVFPNDVFEIEPEKYINDIPFKTKEIFENYLERKSYNSVFQLKEENYIDDIPFCTNEILNSIELCKKYTLPESEVCKNFTFTYK